MFTMPLCPTCFFGTRALNHGICPTVPFYRCLHCLLIQFTNFTTRTILYVHGRRLFSGDRSEKDKESVDTHQFANLKPGRPGTNGTFLQIPTDSYTFHISSTQGPRANRIDTLESGSSETASFRIVRLVEQTQ